MNNSITVFDHLPLCAFRLETEQFNTVLDAMFEYPVEPNQKVIAEGDDGDNFYVIENGVYDVIKVSIFTSLDTNN